LGGAGQCIRRLELFGWMCEICMIDDSPKVVYLSLTKVWSSWPAFICAECMKWKRLFAHMEDLNYRLKSERSCHYPLQITKIHRGFLNRRRN